MFHQITSLTSRCLLYLVVECSETADSAQWHSTIINNLFIERELWQGYSYFLYVFVCEREKGEKLTDFTYRLFTWNLSVSSWKIIGCICPPLHGGDYKPLCSSGVNKMECHVPRLNSTQLSQLEDGVAFSR